MRSNYGASIPFQAVPFFVSFRERPFCKSLKGENGGEKAGVRCSNSRSPRQKNRIFLRDKRNIDERPRDIGADWSIASQSVSGVELELLEHSKGLAEALAIDVSQQVGRTD
uniref:Predicted protein n=1 Tax=Physcomitrium patens TaxID=3218 RepID=A9U6A1_PHYPA